MVQPGTYVIVPDSLTIKIKYISVKVCIIMASLIFTNLVIVYFTRTLLILSMLWTEELYCTENIGKVILWHTECCKSSLFLYVAMKNGNKLGISALDEYLVSNVWKNWRCSLVVFQCIGLAFAWGMEDDCKYLIIVIPGKNLNLSAPVHKLEVCLLKPSSLVVYL